MNWNQVGRKAIATTIQSGTAILIGDGLDLIAGETWKLALVAGLGGLITFAHRTSTEYLEQEEQAEEAPPMLAQYPGMPDPETTEP